MSASNKQEEPPDSSNDYILRFGLLTLIFIGIVTYNLAALPRLDTFVQMLILVAIAINTGETRRMQKEMVRQTRLSMVPGFTVEYFKDGREEALKLINIGNGVATNISIAPLNVEYPFQGQVLLYTLKFDPISYLHSRDTKELKFAIFAQEMQITITEGIEFWVLHDRPPGYPSSLISFSLQLTYQDIEGNRYFQQLEIDKNGCKPGRIKALY